MLCQRYQFFILIIIVSVINKIDCLCNQNDSNDQKLICTNIDAKNGIDWDSTVNWRRYAYTYKILDITAGPETKLTHLTENALNFPTKHELRIHNISTLTELDPNVFGTSYYLDQLQMDFIPFKRINRQFFKNLYRLKKLTITSCQIDTIESGAFDHLNYLTHLDLSLNQIESLPPGLFDSVNDLEILKLNSNKINLLPNNLFLKLTKLKFIDLDSNKIQLLSNKLFRTEQLNSVNSGRVFYESKIEILIVKYNAIERLSSLDYMDMNLRHLDLQYNRIGDAIDSDVFESMPNLQILNLCGNSITNINHIDWSVLTQLQQLNLCANNLTTFNGNIFKTMSVLSKLDFNSNHLNTITFDMLKFATNLRYLNLSLNKIRTIDSMVFSQMKRLKELNLRSNEILHIDSSAFLHTPLLNLNLANNQIIRIDFGTFDSLKSHLLSLNLDNNLIEELVSLVFEPLNNLNVLTLAGNQITKLPVNFFTQMQQLQYLDLSRNQLKTLPIDLFKSLTSLTKLELQRNQIDEINPKTLMQLTNLHYLNLRGNQLIDINENLFNLPYLKFVSVAANRIKYLPKHLLHGSQCNVEELLVFDNRLTFIDNEFFDKTRLKQFSFDRNPWLCKCLEQIDQALIRNNIKSLWNRTDSSQINCITFKNDTCIKDLNLNDEIFAQYTSTRNDTSVNCANSIYC